MNEIPTTFYKYRSLNEFKYILDILINQQLYATNYKNMNDPMEGLFYTYNLDEKCKKAIKGGKKERKFCSLSSKPNELLLWGHYADGCKGIVIELEVDDAEGYISPIKYDAPQTYNNIEGVSIEEILSHKYPCWGYEDEYRVFTNNDYVKIKIKRILFGDRTPSIYKKAIRAIVANYLSDVTCHIIHKNELISKNDHL